jgi:LmbE family N-acetylglucosaminyl deacetylase
MTPIAMTILSAGLLSGLLSPTPGASGAELGRDLERLGHTARVLYVAAHPDDENTHLLTWLANERGWRTAYLSLTRGEGGQNAIGDELGHGLGLIRTWELLTARQIDGAEQWIARQRDFGYSKSAEEALEVWGAETALCDVVGVVRRFRPDVIITRFPEEGTTHGHHLASARLARSAFEQAADPEICAHQLGGDAPLQPWQPTRLLYNVPLRWMGGEVQPEWFTVDIGGYDSLRGHSHGEIAAASRSSHRSQAFGAAARRGPEIEAFALLGGEAPAGDDPFADIPDGWESRPGGNEAARLLSGAISDFDARAPAASIPVLMRAHDAADALAQRDREELQTAIARWVVSAAGIFVDARAAVPMASPGSAVDIDLEVIARGADGWQLRSARLVSATASNHAPAIDAPIVVEGIDGALDRNEPRRATVTATISADAPASAPYWLDGDVTDGAYALEDPALLGRAVGDPPLVAEVVLDLGGASLPVHVPVRFVSVDPTLGERVQPFEIVPPVELRPTRDVLLLSAGDTARVEAVVEAGTAVDGAVISVTVTEGWRVEPDAQRLTLEAGERAVVAFDVTAPSAAGTTQLVFAANVDGRTWSQYRQPVDYPHLPPLQLPVSSSVAASALDWTAPTGTIGYIVGASDAVGDALVAAGLDVRVLDDAAIAGADLDAFDAILVGPRAFNDRAALAAHADRLWDYAARGGNVIVQYQTNNRLQQLPVPPGPVPVEIGRGRVTNERAPMRWLPEADRVRNSPNALSDADFEQWVQERGLYFASEWDDRWVPLLAVADPGEEEQLGALLVTHHGDGAVFYTGLSLFRQLPAGVPGAFRLLANLIEYDAP